MKLNRNHGILFLMFVPVWCVGQDTNNLKTDFIKVYKTQSCPVVPFAEIKTEISDCQICFRNILPPREEMSKEHLEFYDKWDQTPKYKQIKAIDFDSIVNFIMTSGLLSIDLNYTRPGTNGGMVIMKAGACSEGYTIETTKGKLDLLISGAQVFKLPLLLKEFDDLFVRVTDRYKINNE